MKFKLILAAAILLALNSCVRVPLETPQAAMRPSAVPFLEDDLNIESLVSAIRAQAENLKLQDKELIFGPNKIYSKEYARELFTIVDLWDVTKDREKVLHFILDKFEFLEVYGQKRWGEVQITSYFEPVIEGSLTKTEKFSEPLYKKPEDLVSLDLEVFDPKYSKERKMRGRLVNNKLIPYYSREEISSKGALQGKGLEICYVDPVDGFFLQIQGSGVVKLANGQELILNYAEKNGQPYKALGMFLRDYIPRDQITLRSIEKYLHSLDPDKIHSFLNLNPSYVFFRVAEKNAVTSSGLPATGGRTIATDKRYFPEGALAYIEFDNPEIPGKKIRRLVIDQDSGGAILGGGRVDLFWGRGADAKYVAGNVNHKGTLFYLFPRAQLVSSF